MDGILKASGWQVFLIFFIVPVMLASSGLVVPVHFLNGAWLFLSIPLAVFIAQFTIYVWMLAIGSGLYNKMGLKHFFSNRLFLLLVLLPLIGLIAGMFFWVWGVTVLGSGTFSMGNRLVSALWTILPVQILFFVTKIYCFYFSAKVICSAQSGGEAKFADFKRYFFLVLCFPVGVWFLQPVVNRLAGKISTP